ncbi:proteophosphoglycan ppg1, partial [Cystoisospora suis]
TLQLELLRRGEKELKKRLAEQLDRIDLLQQDSLILAQTRAENLNLRLQLQEVQSALNRQTSQLAVLRRAAATNRFDTLIEFFTQQNPDLLLHLHKASTNPSSTSLKQNSSSSPLPLLSLDPSFPASKNASQSKTLSRCLQPNGLSPSLQSNLHASSLFFLQKSHEGEEESKKPPYSFTPSSLPLTREGPHVLADVDKEASGRTHSHSSSGRHMPLFVSSFSSSSSPASSNLPANGERKIIAGGAFLSSSSSTSSSLSKDQVKPDHKFVEVERGYPFINKKKEGEENAKSPSHETSLRQQISSSSPSSLFLLQPSSLDEKRRDSSSTSSRRSVSPHQTRNKTATSTAGVVVSAHATHQRHASASSSHLNPNPNPPHSKYQSFSPVAQGWMEERRRRLAEEEEEKQDTRGEKKKNNPDKQLPPSSSSLPLVRISEGLYLYEGKQLRIKSFNQQLVVETGVGMVPLKSYLFPDSSSSSSSSFPVAFSSSSPSSSLPLPPPPHPAGPLLQASSSSLLFPPHLYYRGHQQSENKREKSSSSSFLARPVDSQAAEARLHVYHRRQENSSLLLHPVDKKEIERLTIHAGGEGGEQIKTQERVEERKSSSSSFSPAAAGGGGGGVSHLSSTECGFNPTTSSTTHNCDNSLPFHLSSKDQNSLSSSSSMNRLTSASSSSSSCFLLPLKACSSSTTHDMKKSLSLSSSSSFLLLPPQQSQSHYTNPHATSHDDHSNSHSHSININSSRDGGVEKGS